MMYKKCTLVRKTSKKNNNIYIYIYISGKTVTLEMRKFNYCFIFIFPFTTQYIPYTFCLVVCSQPAVERSLYWFQRYNTVPGWPVNYLYVSHFLVIDLLISSSFLNLQTGVRIMEEGFHVDVKWSKNKLNSSTML